MQPGVSREWLNERAQRKAGVQGTPMGWPTRLSGNAIMKVSPGHLQATRRSESGLLTVMLTAEDFSLTSQSCSWTSVWHAGRGHALLPPVAIARRFARD